MHAKQHISNDNMVKHEKCNVCSKVVRNKAELKMHTESVYNKECELCLNMFRNQLELRKHVDNVHIFEGDKSKLDYL